MNIFVSDLDPVKSAQNLDDKRLNKMIVESFQIYTNILVFCGIYERFYPKTKNGWLFKPTHKNHPCVKWSYYSIQNFNWLKAHTQALCSEYAFRFKKEHFTGIQERDTIGNPELFDILKEKLPDRFDGFCNCTGIKSDDNVVKLYRICLNNKWDNDKRPPKWTNSKPPEWKTCKEYEI